eukprot:gnl/MRDRNA2_/MRDRNA2_53754_c0_seq1.p1 gnl/MRDRNA2_/MRDRNA2_53754_c0~~gnl/MRDRNA2_/MRDRNA2_53754_c0_seq1.p1  ORF type:complete len:291 (+),score=52.12 gnl/MRDRNA2_/MRDRNA2_53754_c0_seq1:90-962(+)
MVLGNQYVMSAAVSMDPVVVWSDNDAGRVYLEKKNTFLEFSTEESKALKRGAYPRSASADSHFHSSGRSLQSTAPPTNRSSSPSNRSMWSSENEAHRIAECVSPSSTVSTSASIRDYEYPLMTMPAKMAALPCVNESQNEKPRKPHGAKGETASQVRPRKHNLKKLNRGGAVSKDAVTTLMIRGIPCSFSQEALIALLDDAGLKAKYDFFYLPRDGNRNSNLGYAFINFVDPYSAEICTNALEGVPLAPGRSQKFCMVAPADIQGLPSLWKHFRRTAVSRGAHGPMFLQV